MRQVLAQSLAPVASGVHRVVAFTDLASGWQPDLRYLVLLPGATPDSDIERIARMGLPNVGHVVSGDLEPGDIVVPRGPGGLSVLYRPSDTHHALQLTNRCNSHCLMCSQPPTPQDDSWRIGEALDVIQHIDQPPECLGLTGGEPLLLGSSLRTILDEFQNRHPSTRIDVLTNGRLLGQGAMTKDLLTGLDRRVSWLVPLYGHTDFLHDFVVQAHGAFDETIAGLLALQEYGQAIQLRIVLIEPVLVCLPELCRFIGRNLPFVREVALMACEPIGFALANRDLCAVDLQDWTHALEDGCRVLKRHGVPYLFMNTPLCALPRALWPHAHRSISDWKTAYAEECSGCAVRAECSGLFAWHERGWTPTTIRRIEVAV